MSDELARLLAETACVDDPARPKDPRRPIPIRVRGGPVLEEDSALLLASPPGERASDPVAGRPEDAQIAGPSIVAGVQVQVKHLKKAYQKGPISIPVLKGVSFSVHAGEFVAIVGQSGSGKSTLLHLMGTLDSPDSGEVHFEGRRIDNLPSHARDALRNRGLGMIFQFYHLLPELTTLENVLAPLMIGQPVWDYLRNRRQYAATARQLAELVGLGHRLKHKPRELSGGEMQRAAIARALAANPRVLLADEPTGNLDQGTGREILEILRTLNRQQKLTIVMVTHDPAIARQADRTLRLTDGRIVGA